MATTLSASCYIDEYEVSPGRLGARLREKITGRIVVLGFSELGEKQRFLRFLSGAADRRNDIPDVFSKHGDLDAVKVTGEVDFNAPDELRFVYNERLVYTFA